MTVLRDGRVLVAGGQLTGSATEVLSTAELFDPSSGQFHSVGSMTDARRSHTATLLLSGEVLVAGVREPRKSWPLRTSRPILSQAWSRRSTVRRAGACPGRRERCLRGGLASQGVQRRQRPYPRHCATTPTSGVVRRPLSGQGMFTDASPAAMTSRPSDRCFGYLGRDDRRALPRTPARRPQRLSA